MKLTAQTSELDTPTEILRAYKLPTIIVAIGIIFAVLGFQMALQYDMNQSEQTFHELSDQIYRTLDSEMLRHEQQVTALARMMEEIQEVTKNEFSNVAQSLTHETKFMRISEYRIATSGELEEPFIFRRDADEDARLIDYIRLREGLLTARKTKTNFFSEPYEAVEGNDRFFVTALIAPVVEDRQPTNRFIVGFINMSDLFRDLFGDYNEKIHVRIFDGNATSHNMIYEQYASDAGKNFLTNMRANEFESLSYNRKRDFGEHQWDVRIYSAISGFPNTVGLFPWITFFSLLTLTVLIGYITFRITIENINARLIVEKQTESLREYTRRLEASNRDLDDFAHIASHDLKEPLRGMYNYAEFLLEDYGDKLDEEGHKKLTTLKTLSRRMERLIDGLLEYSRISRQDLAFRKADINDVVKEALENISVFVKENNATIVVQPNLPEVTCDHVKAGQVFANLMTNAIKYNDKDDKTVEVGCTRERPEFPGKPVFYVRDNGIGIPAEYQNAVFKIFKRLHGRDEFGGGTGSGLTIVKKIVDRHGGDIWIESKEGSGTTFYFTLEAYES